MNGIFKLVKGFENAPLKVNAINQSLFIHPKEVQHLFHDMMEHSAQVISNVSVVKASQKPYLRCSSHQVSYDALFDTGADISCMNENIFRKIPIHLRPPRSVEHSPKQFTTAGGQALNVKGKFSGVFL